MFESRFDELKSIDNTYFIVTIEDTTVSKVVATGTLVIERKFTHMTGRVGHIEDIVVDIDYRKKKLGTVYVFRPF